RISSLVGWDQQTYMPPGGSAARAEQSATLQKIVHEIFTADETGRLLDAATGEVSGLEPDSDDARLVSVTRRDYEKSRKVSADLVAEIARVTGQAVDVWTEARAASDWKPFSPYLTRIFALQRQLADALGYSERMYDALLDKFEPDMKTAQVKAVFDAIKPDLIDLVKAIAAKGDVVSDEVLHREYDEQKQWDFGLEVVKRYGFDFKRGRQDRSVHPFTTSFSINDVRITTRVDRHFLSPALFGTLHETGHALYEQGFSQSLERTPLADGASLGMHESQSRMWENLVGRSQPFWKFFFPILQGFFPAQLADQTAASFQRAANKVSPSFIRVEADEVTYGLHIMLRFEMENDLLEGHLKAADVPEAWNAKMQEFLGVTPPSTAQGALQDIHWSSGLIGYFPTYQLGNLISLQLWDKINAAIPDLTSQIERGEFAALLDWLRTNLHQHGRKFTSNELLQRITGSGLNPAPYLKYLKAKYRAIYGL
ncbi:MAG TPA: carboxypeptidase M32, partial [Anaerolineae bacterium]|nr:carboxypeptidase M32 [Anaerolineae bacterium]